MAKASWHSIPIENIILIRIKEMLFMGSKSCEISIPNFWTKIYIIVISQNLFSRKILTLVSSMGDEEEKWPRKRNTIIASWSKKIVIIKWRKKNNRNRGNQAHYF